MNVQSLVAKVWNFAHVLRDQGVAAEIYKTYLHCAAKIIRSEGGSITSYDGDRIMGIFIGDDHSTSAARCCLRINYAVREIVNPALKVQYTTFGCVSAISSAFWK